MYEGYCVKYSGRIRDQSTMVVGESFVNCDYFGGEKATSTEKSAAMRDFEKHAERSWCLNNVEIFHIEKLPNLRLGHYKPRPVHVKVPDL